MLKFITKITSSFEKSFFCSGFEGTAELLIQRGIDVNLAPSEGFTPLLRAAFNGKKVVRTLFWCTHQTPYKILVPDQVDRITVVSFTLFIGASDSNFSNYDTSKHIPSE